MEVAEQTSYIHSQFRERVNMMLEEGPRDNSELAKEVDKQETVCAVVTTDEDWLREEETMWEVEEIDNVEIITIDVVPSTITPHNSPMACLSCYSNLTQPDLMNILIHL